MDIIDATRSYETWMGRCTVLVPADLRDKHTQMRSELFAFFRGTFYRWAQQWPEVSRDLRHAPRVLAVADLHVDSFGTWRDAEGRLCWGVDDFDEAYPLPYTSDLCRLAASAKIVIDAEQLAMKFKDACDAILEGYRDAFPARRMPLRARRAGSQSRATGDRGPEGTRGLLADAAETARGTHAVTPPGATRVPRDAA